MAIDVPESDSKKNYQSHYRQFVIHIHEESKVNLDDLLELLQSRADEAGETLTLKTTPRRAGVTYVVSPKKWVRATAEERARKRLLRAVDAARKAGIDPRDLLE